MNKARAALTLMTVTACSLATVHTTADAAPQDCVATTLRAGTETVGTIAAKSSSSACHGLNLTYAHRSGREHWDEYAGMYETASGWKFGASGYVLVDNGQYPVGYYVLVPDLAPGTRFSVASQDGTDTVDITH
ncbi:hypothetical protein ACFH04_10270 [Streptomyces noboritoensis]|uniref:Secreted protein n=1 Tax=Streptomyces noboritoensis TaxID=67337 RepID=A0ABV6TE67_9ACTN